MISLLIITGILIAVALSGFFSGIETAAYSVNTIQLQTAVDEGGKRVLLVSKMLKDMPRLITTMLIGTNLAIFVATSLLTNLMVSYSIDNAELVTTLFLTPFCFIFAESLPKRIAFEHPNTSLVYSARAVLFFEILFYPIAIILSGFGNLLKYMLDLRGKSNSVIVGKVRLYENLEAKTADGTISLKQYQMASSVMEHEQTTISQLMLNPVETFTIEDTASLREAGLQMRSSGYGRALIRNRFMRFTGEIITLNTIMNNTGKLDQPVSIATDKAMILKKNVPILHAISQMREVGARIAIVTSNKGVFIGSIHLNTMINSIVHGITES